MGAWIWNKHSAASVWSIQPEGGRLKETVGLVVAGYIQSRERSYIETPRKI